MNLDLTDAEAAALVTLLKRTIAEDQRRVDAASPPGGRAACVVAAPFPPLVLRDNILERCVLR
jgi:hypothetical protein